MTVRGMRQVIRQEEEEVMWTGTPEISVVSPICDISRAETPSFCFV